MQLCPNEALLYKYVGGENQTSNCQGGIIRLRSENDNYYIKLGKYIMACCGVAEMSGMHSQLDTENLDRSKQDYLTTILRNFGYGKTFHFIITDQQIERSGKTGNSVYEFLMELGAKCVDNMVSQLHDSNELQTHIWSPRLNMDKLEKYVTKGKHRDFDTTAEVNPLWWTKLSKDEQKEMLLKYPEKTRQQINDEYNQQQAQIRERQVQERKANLRMMEMYYPEYIQELGWRKLTREQIALIEKQSNKVVKKSKADIQKALSAQLHNNSIGANKW